ncbi:antibiotic biosynthesis monooxygenase [Pseudomonas sp. LRF_L74]|uniref:antibiotic biosynthesis monooxygenase n=1 Tax=Pseudomonas sp. LRF_L74 TaxID=3369422 RepID=UPI003F5E72A7
MMAATGRLWFTQLIEFDVPPPFQQGLVEALTLRSERLVASHDGLLAASVQASDDGRRVLQCLQWQSRQDCEAALDSLSREPFVDLLRRHAARGVSFSTFQTVSGLARSAGSALYCQLTGR